MQERRKHMEREKIQDFNKKVEQLKTIFDEDIEIKYLCDDECKDFEVVVLNYNEETGLQRRIMKIDFTNELLIIKNHVINVQCNSERCNLQIVAGALTGLYSFLGDDKRPMGYLGLVSRK